jgi:Glycosyltransferase
LIKKIVFWLQRISPEKDLKTLIDAIPEVAREIPDVLFIIKGRKSGDDKYYNYILQYCRKRLSAYFKNVQLSFKYVNHTKLPYYYNSSDIFVLTSRLEGFGLALVEAMSCGKPVVATNAASVPEIVGDAGILFEPGNSKDLSKKLIELLINEDSKAAYGIKARKRVIENFNWSKSAEQYCNIYSQYL